MAPFQDPAEVSASQPEEARWTRWFYRMFTAALLLALGSLLILLAPVTSFGGVPLDLSLSILATPVLALHLSAWYLLGSSLLGLPETMVRVPKRAMTASFVASLLGFAFGLLTLPLWAPSAVYILVRGYFPFLPSVYGPVVGAHALLFLFLTRSLRDRRSHFLLVAGSLFLLVIAAAAIAGQLAFLADRPLAWVSLGVSLAGLAGLGYALIAVGLRSEYHAEKPRGGQEGLSRPFG